MQIQLNPYRWVYVISVLALIAGCVPADESARVVVAADGHHEYETYDAESGKWLGIMLPDTELGMTVFVSSPDGMKKLSTSQGKRGHPTGLKDFESQEKLKQYARSCHIEKFVPLKDGMAVVKVSRTDPVELSATWTAWTQELLGTVLAEQKYDSKQDESTP